MDERNKAINDSLVRIYGDIMWIEENELRKSKFNDLTMREMQAIHALSMYDHKSTSEVAKELHLTPGTLTSMADRLVRKGYVIRLRSEDDRRVIRLGFTKMGLVVYLAHEAFNNMMVKSFLKDLDATEIKTIEKALWNLEQFLREHS